MSRRTNLGGALALALGLLGCGGERSSSGLSAYLRATNAQFEPGELSTTVGDAKKPSVDNVKSNNSHVFPGAQGRTVTGSVTGTATALLLGLAGDSAHWLVPVGGIADLDVEGNVLFTTSLSFSPDLPPGDRNLVFRAVDADGVVGPAQTLALKVDVEAPTPKGALLIDLQWDTQADLDLHVHITPDDATIKPFDVWEKAPTALPAGTLTDDNVKTAGKLSLDSNARCAIDGTRLERLQFDTAYPVGTYEVRVDTFSLCGEPTARWHAKAYRNLTGTPETIVEAYGQSLDRDTVGDHNATSGLFALDFLSP